MMRKHSTRSGCQPLKIMFSILVKTVVVSDGSHLRDGALLSVCFERGGKISSTKNRELDFHRHKLSGPTNSVASSIIMPMEERVELVATLYKDPKTNQYQEKSGKLILRQLKRNLVFNLDTFKGIGIHQIQLHTLANEMNFSTIRTSPVMKLHLEMLPTGSYLEVVVTSTILRNNPFDLENRSVLSALSDTSDISMIGATFDHTGGRSNGALRSGLISTDFNAGQHFAGSGMKLQHKQQQPFTSTATTGGTLSTTFGHQSSKSSNQEMADDEDDEQKQQQPVHDSVDVVSEDCDHNIPAHTSTESRSNPPSAKVSPRTPVSTTHPFAVHHPLTGHRDATAETTEKSITNNVGTSESSSGLYRSQEEPDAVVVEPAPLPTEQSLPAAAAVHNSGQYMGGGDGDGDGGHSRTQNCTNNSEAFELHTSELTNKTNRISGLEQELQQQAAAYKQQILDLQTRCLLAERRNSTLQERESSSRNILTTAYDRADVQIAEQLSLARDETAAISVEYGRTLAELQVVTEEVVYYRQLAEAAQREKREEMENAREAASVAVKACLRRAELESENESLIEELINIKVKHADLSYDLDTALRRSCIDRKRLQCYAEQLAALEIRHATVVMGDHRPSNSGGGDKVDG